MFDIGLSEILVILVVALIVLGPQKLPDVARALGRGLSEFRRALDDMKEELNTDQVKKEADDLKDSLLFGKAFSDEEKKKEPAAEKPESPAEKTEPTDQADQTKQESREK